MLGYSGSGISSDLRRVMEKERIWEKHGLNVKSIYFNSGSILTQAMLGGNIVVSDSGVPEMMTLPVSGAMETKVITVNINRLEHIFVTRKNVAKTEDLKGKKIAVSRFGSASDLTTRMVLRSWKLDPGKRSRASAIGQHADAHVAPCSPAMSTARLSVPKACTKSWPAAVAARSPIFPNCPSTSRASASPCRQR